MLIKQGTKGMDEKDKKEIIKKINSNNSEDEELPEDDIDNEEEITGENDSVNDETTEMTEMPMESKKFSLNRIVESVCDNLVKEFTEEFDEEPIEEEELPSEEVPVMESFQKMLNRIIAEEVTRLNVFGKHPGYRKKPMTTPANKEVVKTSGDKDWNDDSVKGEVPFGSKIGSSAPYEQQVKVLTDAVMKNIAESLKKK
jgi:hypothetical protein